MYTCVHYDRVQYVNGAHPYLCVCVYIDGSFMFVREGNYYVHVHT